MELLAEKRLPVQPPPTALLPKPAPFANYRCFSCPLLVLVPDACGAFLPLPVLMQRPRWSGPGGGGQLRASWGDPCLVPAVLSGGTTRGRERERWLRAQLCKGHVLRPRLILTLLAVAASNALASCGKHRANPCTCWTRALWPRAQGRDSRAICIILTILQMGLSCKKLLHKVKASSWKKGVIKTYSLWLTSKPRTQLGGCPGKPPVHRAVPKHRGRHSCWLGSATHCCALRPPFLGAPWYRQQDTPVPSNGQSHGDLFPVCMAAFPISTVFGSTTDLSALLTNEIFGGLSAG